MANYLELEQSPFASLIFTVLQLVALRISFLPSIAKDR
jgi:hypothetical protein